jgi:hypothetical protein
VYGLALSTMKGTSQLARIAWSISSSTKLRYATVVVIFLCLMARGSALHVMFSLCHSSRQVVVANEQLNGANAMGEILGERQPSRPRRETRWRNVLLKRSIWLVLRANLLIARCCAAGMTPSYTTYSGTAETNRVTTLWLFAAFDTDGEVSFVGIRTLTNLFFRPVPKAHCAYFRLRHQYRFW